MHGAVHWPQRSTAYGSGKGNTRFCAGGKGKGQGREAQQGAQPADGGGWRYVKGGRRQGQATGGGGKGDKGKGGKGDKGNGKGDATKLKVTLRCDGCDLRQAFTRQSLTDNCPLCKEPWGNLVVSKSMLGIEKPFSKDGGQRGQQQPGQHSSTMEMALKLAGALEDPDIDEEKGKALLQEHFKQLMENRAAAKAKAKDVVPESRNKRERMVRELLIQKQHATQKCLRKRDGTADYLKKLDAKREKAKAMLESEDEEYKEAVEAEQEVQRQLQAVVEEPTPEEEDWDLDDDDHLQRPGVGAFSGEQKIRRRNGQGESCVEEVVMFTKRDFDNLAPDDKEVLNRIAKNCQLQQDLEKKKAAAAKDKKDKEDLEVLAAVAKTTAAKVKIQALEAAAAAANAAAAQAAAAVEDARNDAAADGDAADASTGANPSAMDADPEGKEAENRRRKAIEEEEENEEKRRKRA